LAELGQQAMSALMRSPSLGIVAVVALVAVGVVAIAAVSAGSAKTGE
jgi:hypothetical protein